MLPEELPWALAEVAPKDSSSSSTLPSGTVVRAPKGAWPTAQAWAAASTSGVEVLSQPKKSAEKDEKSKPLLGVSHHPKKTLLGRGTVLFIHQTSNILTPSIRYLECTGAFCKRSPANP